MRDGAACCRPEGRDDGLVAMSRMKALEDALASLQRRVAALEQWHRRAPSPRISPAALEAARKRAGWTMAEAAKVCGVAQSTWYRWESGEHLCSGDTALTVVGEFSAAGADPPVAIE